jgi:hypothetical protein
MMKTDAVQSEQSVSIAQRRHRAGPSRRHQSQACARAALNAELRTRDLPLRAARGTALSSDSRIEFEHRDGVRSVLCEADGDRLYILQQRLGRNGERLTEDEEQRLRGAWSAAYTRSQRSGMASTHEQRRSPAFEMWRMRWPK